MAAATADCTVADMAITVSVSTLVVALLPHFPFAVGVLVATACCCCFVSADLLIPLLLLSCSQFIVSLR